MEAIKEQVPVFEGNFRITQDVTASASKIGDGIRAVLSATKTISINGELRYQARDKDHLLSTHIGTSKMGVAGSTTRSEAISQGHSAQMILARIAGGFVEIGRSKQ